MTCLLTTTANLSIQQTTLTHKLKILWAITMGKKSASGKSIQDTHWMFPQYRAFNLQTEVTSSTKSQPHRPKNIFPLLKQYLPVWHALTVHKEALSSRNPQNVVPAGEHFLSTGNEQDCVIDIAHDGHLGIVCMKKNAGCKDFFLPWKTRSKKRQMAPFPVKQSHQRPIEILLYLLHHMTYLLHK